MLQVEDAYNNALEEVNELRTSDDYEGIVGYMSVSQVKTASVHTVSCASWVWLTRHAAVHSSITRFLPLGRTDAANSSKRATASDPPTQRVLAQMFDKVWPKHQEAALAKVEAARIQQQQQRDQMQDHSQQQPQPQQSGQERSSPAGVHLPGLTANGRPNAGSPPAAVPVSTAGERITSGHGEQRPVQFVADAIKTPWRLRHDGAVVRMSCSQETQNQNRTVTKCHCTKHHQTVVPLE